VCGGDVDRRLLRARLPFAALGQELGQRGPERDGLALLEQVLTGVDRVAGPLEPP